MSTFGCFSGASLPRGAAGPHLARTSWHVPHGSRCRPIVLPGTAPTQPCLGTPGAAPSGFALSLSLCRASLESLGSCPSHSLYLAAQSLSAKMFHSHLFQHS